MTSGYQVLKNVNKTMITHDLYNHTPLYYFLDDQWFSSLKKHKQNYNDIF